MEMKINKELIKTQRTKRAWSQGQLADASGLSLRTIQRIEKDGVASLESAKSLAAVFEMGVDALYETEKAKWPGRWSVAAVFTAVLLAVNGLILMPATAKPIMVSLSVSSQEEDLANMQLLNEENQESEMVISDKLKVVLKAVDEGGAGVRISTHLYDLSDGDEVLLASPEVLTKHKETAEIRFSGYRLSLTPYL